MVTTVGDVPTTLASATPIVRESTAGPAAVAPACALVKTALDPTTTVVSTQVIAGSTPIAAPVATARRLSECAATMPPSWATTVIPQPTNASTTPIARVSEFRTARGPN